MKILFKDLDSIPAPVSSAAVVDAFGPFLCAHVKAGDRHRYMRLVRWNAVKRAVRRLVAGGQTPAIRGEDLIKGEYESTWSRGYAAYDLSAGCKRPECWIYRSQRLWADRAGIPRLRNLLLGGVIRALQPKSVLEVGSGNGINLLLLANQFPDVSFTGVELTTAGNRVARELQSSGMLPAALGLYPVDPGIDGQAFRRINFLQGDATAMPFESGSFDLVITVLSVEQMERVRHKALAEIARVCGGHVLNLEPFAEANRTGLRRLHVYGRDYFRGSISDLPRYGLEPLWATMDFPQEVQLGAALVLSRKCA